MSRPRFLTKLGLRDRAQVVVFAYESGLVEAGAVALGLLALIATERALVDAERLDSVYRPLSFAMAGGAGTALVVSWARPGPWLLSLLLVAILLVLWFFAVSRFLRADAWGEA